MFETAKQSCNLRDEGQRVAYSNESPPIVEPHTNHFERAHLLAQGHGVCVAGQGALQ